MNTIKESNFQINIETNDEKLMPLRYHKYDAGADIFCSEDSVTIPPKSWKLISSGIRVNIPQGYVGLVSSKSGLASKGLFVMNSPGIIDSGYTGIITVNIVNFRNEEYTFKKYDKLAQFIIQKVVIPEFVVGDVKNISTTRGECGHGSTGFSI